MSTTSSKHKPSKSFAQLRQKILLLFVSFLLILGIGYYFFPKQTAKPIEPLIAITQIVQHPSLDKIRQGVIDELEENGYVDGKTMTLVYENAQGNIATAAQIGQKFAGLPAKVIVAIATPSAQTVQAAVRERNMAVVFSAVTDPLGAQLVQNLEHPGGNITGTIDLPPIAEQIKILRDSIADLRVIGVVYNPGEVNSVIQVEKFKELAEKQGLEVVMSAATKTSEVRTAATQLASRVQAFYIPNDNTVVSALEGIIQVSVDKKIPIMASDPDSVNRGATMAVANDQYDVGRETGKLVIRILQGAAPAQISVVSVKKAALYVNEDSVKRLGLELVSSDSSAN